MAIKQPTFNYKGIFSKSSDELTKIFSHYMNVDNI